MPSNFDPQTNRVAVSPTSRDRSRDPGPSLFDSLGAAFLQENVTGSFINEAVEQSELDDNDPDFNPLNHLREGEQLVASRFSEADSREDMERIRNQIEEERQRRRVLQESGTFQELFATGAAAILDPINLIPVGAGARGATALGSVARGAVAGAGSNAVAEAGLQASQDLRTFDESVANVLMGGALGAGFGALGRGLRASNARRNSPTYAEVLSEAGQAVHDTRVGGTPTQRPTVSPSSAAGADVARADDQDFRLAGERALRTVGRALRFGGIGTRAFVPASLDLGLSNNSATRRAFNRIFDVGLIRQGDVKGTVGPNAETQIRATIDRANKQIGRSFSDTVAEAQRQLGRRLSRQEKTDLEAKVAQSLRRGDQPPGDTQLDQLAANVAQRVRSNVINPLTNEAIRLGILRSDLKTKFAKSFFPRKFDLAEVRNRRGELKKRIVNAINTSLRVGDRQPGEEIDDVVRRADSEEATQEQASQVDAVQGEPVQLVNETGEIENFLSSRLAGDEDVELLAESILNRIEGGPAGRLDEFAITVGERGSLKERTLPITDEALEDFLDNDAQGVLAQFAMQMARDIEIARLAREEVEPRLSAEQAARSPQEIEAERQAEIQERLDTAVRRKQQAQKKRENAKRRAVRGLRTSQLNALGQIRRSLAARLPRKDAQAVFSRLEDSPTYALDPNLARWLDEIGHEDIASTVRVIHDEVGTDLPKPTKQALERRTEAERELAEAEDEITAQQNRLEQGKEAESLVSRTQQQFIDEIKEEAERRAQEAETQEAARRIRDEAEREQQMLNSMIERLRGLDNPARTPELRKLTLLGRIARQFNVSRLMGSVALSQLPDLGIISVREGGARAFGATFRELSDRIRATGIESAPKRELDLAGLIAIDTQAQFLNARFGSEDTPLPVGRENLLERGEQAGQSLQQMVFDYSGATAVNNAFQSVAGRLAADRLARTSRQIAQGAEPGRRRRIQLGRSGLTPDMATRIGQQVERFAEENRGELVANTARWTDAGARDAFRNAIVQDVNNEVLRPGQADVPIWMNTELGKTIGQFRRFAAASVTRLLAQTAQDMFLNPQAIASIFGSLTSMMFLGGLTVALRDVAIDGQLTERDAQQWGFEAFDRSGLGFAFFEMDALQSSFTGLSLQEGLAGQGFQRFNRRGPIEQVGGPTVGILESGLPQGVQAAIRFASEPLGADTEFREKDLQNARRLVPFQNHFVIRSFIDKTIETIAAETPVEETEDR